jgi:hypothetical protein
MNTEEGATGGVTLESGEIVVLRPDGEKLTVVG